MVVRRNGAAGIIAGVIVRLDVIVGVSVRAAVVRAARIGAIATGIAVKFIIAANG